MKFKVGDKVKCIDASNSYLEYGKVYEVLGTSNDCQCIQVTDDYHIWWSVIRFELVKEEAIMHKFKVGDVVKIVGAEDGNHSKWDDTDEFKNSWPHTMDQFIGKAREIMDVTKFGVVLADCDGYRFPPQALEIYTEEMKIQKDKKYRVVGTHAPVRIICTDKASKLQCVALYTDHRGEESLILVSDGGLDCWGVKFIEEVPEIDWSKVVIDTPIWIGTDYQPRHFAEFKNNFVYYYTDGRSSHTSNGMVAVSKSFAALTNPNEKA